MEKPKILELNTPETEIQFELMLIATGNADKLNAMISDGWGLYPQVLNAMVAYGYGQNRIFDLLKIVSKYENYPVDELKTWIEIYYYDKWKHLIVKLGLHKIAAKFFTDEECESFGLGDALKYKALHGPWAKFADAEGIDTVKKTYLNIGNRSIRTASQTVKDNEQMIEIERFLCYRGEYAFLYGRQCWRALSCTLDGVKYIAETKHYMNGLAECLFAHYDTMTPNVSKYCISVLDKASLDDHYRPRYQEWKQKHNIV
ncbi:MAG: hypothetical protein IJ770_01500 [Alphaproteobacteria bacterium]|nr:hypothetical protein [Alphaproteobacteria bacterium]